MAVAPRREVGERLAKMASEKETAKKRIRELTKAINYHRRLYHVYDKSEISPEALDSLKRELTLLEEKYPEFVNPDSPTQRAEGKPIVGVQKVKNEISHLS